MDEHPSTSLPVAVIGASAAAQAGTQQVEASCAAGASAGVAGPPPTPFDKTM